MTAAVSFRNVDIVFGKRPQAALPLIDAGRSRAEIQTETGQILGVAGASFDIEEGELIVLMGLSGSGKSTLLRAVNGLNQITRGEVLVHNGDASVNPSACTPQELRALRRGRIAMVFQQFALLPWRTVRENVGFGLELAGLPTRERRRKVDEQLELVGLAQWGDKYVHELSGGMQQRVGLARAFATDAPILLMDEPFSALDPLIRGHLQDELLALQDKLNKTIVFVSHDLDEAAKIGNRIAIMEGGRVIQLGTPQQIVRKPASDYVAEFVAHMNPLGVLRARDIMRALDEGEAGGLGGAPRCAPKTPVREVIALTRSGEGPVLVCDGDTPLGLVGEGEILDCLR
ncbi:choline ABC transporter ATP-binding protein [Stappia indica]|uniref:Trimethylamine N-oxide transport system ATP-binding protein TmoW n=1 Tax=Stappia indica TaxID=538381 RepID=A0A857CC41_9HYPH|nr:choline ABC transporter ATP-binding protein [Stappia indica]QGZ36425.1 choline ABC transporter ATP-binding protein [Stappia indica]